MLKNPRRTGDGPPPLSVDAALFLDFDGSLVELALRPDRVAVEPRLATVLSAVATRLNGALAIITGRRLADIDALLAPLRLPGAGAHGAEWREHGDAPAELIEVPGVAGLLSALRERFGKDPRLLIEDKGAAVALHFREAPECAGECVQAMTALAATRPEFDVVVGHQVVEARPRGVDKGQALRRFLPRAPFAGREPVFVGDDTSDEDAFAAAAAAGGYGIKVGPGRTRARYRIDDVDGVHTWLRAGAEDAVADGALRKQA